MVGILASSFSEFWKEQYEEAFGGIGEAVHKALTPEFVNFFGLRVDPAVFTALIVSGFLIFAALLIRIFLIPKFKKNPKGIQLLLETLVTYFDRSATESVHRSANFVGPYIFTAAIYIVLGVLVEMLGLRPPFASINACFGMGIMTFLVINFCGFKEKKLGRIKRYLNPLNIITDLSVPLSLSLRIFGAILSGYIISELLYSIVFASFVLPAVAAVITTILHALLQAYLFAMLTTIFVSEATE